MANRPPRYLNVGKTLWISGFKRGADYTKDGDDDDICRDKQRKDVGRLMQESGVQNLNTNWESDSVRYVILSLTVSLSDTLLTSFFY